MATVAARTRPRRTARLVSVLAAGAVLTGLTGCTSGGEDSGDAAGETLVTTSATAEASAGPTPEPTATESETWSLPGPDGHAEVGDLVEGFPTDLLPVPSDAIVLVTSAVPVGDADVQEVSLNLRTQATAQDLVRLYRTALLEAGFTETEQPGTQSDLAAESVFTRSGGDEIVSIGVLEVDGGRTVTIGGRIRTTS
ncbi:hypothetical protein J4G33_02015 [Actinotalea sp. BY-33]|uniref:Uncharacterized protein n=1 Tax=Actinotalea soli TaxID=2819234 RepID=A0A939LNI9_9CELL|nr:hypothetical protein [Actinotalea soli]MBO1750573.1 hypothetical protein [Actinotalea soli]